VISQSPYFVTIRQLDNAKTEQDLKIMKNVLAWLNITETNVADNKKPIENLMLREKLCVAYILPKFESCNCFK